MFLLTSDVHHIMDKGVSELENIHNQSKIEKNPSRDSVSRVEEDHTFIKKYHIHSQPNSVNPQC